MCEQVAKQVPKEVCRQEERQECYNIPRQVPREECTQAKKMLKIKNYFLKAILFSKCQFFIHNHWTEK